MEAIVKKLSPCLTKTNLQEVSDGIAIAAIVHRDEPSALYPLLPRVMDLLTMMNFLIADTKDPDVICALILLPAYEEDKLDERIRLLISKNTARLLQECTNTKLHFYDINTCCVLIAYHRLLLMISPSNTYVQTRLNNLLSMRALHKNSRRLKRISGHGVHTSIVTARPAPISKAVECAGDAFERLYGEKRWPCKISCMSMCGDDKKCLLSLKDIQRFRKKPEICHECKYTKHLLIDDDAVLGVHSQDHPLLV
jgi:hypothetical protein